jgi:hypothetical protein
MTSRDPWIRIEKGNLFEEGDFIYSLTRHLQSS